MKTKRDNFVNAAHRLAEAVTDYRNIRNDTVRDGMIQRFEFTFELGWKALKEYMLDAGMQNTLQFPKQVLREAYAAERKKQSTIDAIWKRNAGNGKSSRSRSKPSNCPLPPNRKENT